MSHPHSRQLSDPFPETNSSLESYLTASPSKTAHHSSSTHNLKRNISSTSILHVLKSICFPSKAKCYMANGNQSRSPLLACVTEPKNHSAKGWQRRQELEQEKNNNASGRQRRQELEEEVAELEKVLEDEEKLHEVLVRAHLPHAVRATLHIPNFLPKKTKELLAELVMVEEEIARLESEISTIQQNSNQQLSIPPTQVFESKTTDKKLSLETRPMFFINQAIKGDYMLHGFTCKGNNGSSLETVDKKETEKVVGFHEGVPWKSGVIEKHQSPKPPRHSAARPLDSNAEILRKTLQEPSFVSTTSEKSSQKWQPNKLSEEILRCLICIFLRLIRTTRVLELEKLGNLSRSSKPFIRSKGFPYEKGLNSATSRRTRRGTGQQDPYGIFEIEDSLVRDIGPYKNLGRFASSSFDLKGISSCLSLLSKLRILLSDLRDVDLRSLNHHQKLAFWINNYNTCIMHGFLEHGLPSNPESIIALRSKAMLNIGGNKLNAVAIEHFILRQPSNNQESSWKSDTADKDDDVRSMYGLEQPEPNITFALCCGNRSSPSVRIYTVDGVSAELERSKLEYLQASIGVTAAKRLMIPKLLVRNMHDFAMDLGSLVEWICDQLPASGSLRKSITECIKGLRNSEEISDILEILPYDSTLQFLLPIT